MTQLNFEVFYPHPPERVWQAITNRRALAAWLMDNNFEPRLGHKFQFFPQSLPGLESINCQVLELDEPKRLVYTWQDSLMRQPSLVIWTLKPVDDGTQLKLEHIDRVAQPSQPLHLSRASFNHSIDATLNPLHKQTGQRTSFQSGVINTNFDANILNFTRNTVWQAALNNRLQNLLQQETSVLEH